jgi:alpha-galactosidase
MEFFSILRKPDKVTGVTEETPFRFEEDGQEVCPVKYEYKIIDGVGKLTVYPSGSPIKYLKLRWRGELNFVEKVYGDQWERAGVNGAYLEWRSVMANRILPWFTYLYADKKTACYGVKTGADSFAYWRVDTHGITLFVNLCCGNEGVNLTEPLLALEVVELFGEKNEDVYSVAKRFSSIMCEKPVLPKEPIFGVNNWYWAYGEISQEVVEKETDYLMEMCKGTKHRPYMVVDDGWQINRTFSSPPYIGGPWNHCNEKFESLDKMVKYIHGKGAKAGIWFRPLLTMGVCSSEAVLEYKSANGGGLILDPSHPYTLEHVYNDAKMFSDLGFDLLKHDFTVMDVNGFGLSADNNATSIFKEGRKFYDKTKTTATIIKNLYKAIQRGFGDKDIIACNTISHLTAGIHSIYRAGNDNSGYAFEWTRRDGINSVMRLPLNNTFYNVDPDCAAFTEKTHARENLDFLRMCAVTGMTAFASVKPGILSKEEIKEINEIFKIADENKKFLGIKNYEKNANPEEFISEDGKEYVRFDWDKVYDGARNVVDWFN